MTDDSHSHNSGLLALLANGAQTNANFDFGDINKSYWEGLDQRFKNDFRDKLAAGLPKIPGTNQVDWGQAAPLFAGGGQIDSAINAGKLGVEQQNRQGVPSDAQFIATGREGVPQQQPPQQPPLPSSLNRSGMAVVARPLNKGGEVRGATGPTSTGGDQVAGGSGMVTPAQFMGQLGIPAGYNREVGLAAFKRYGIEPDQSFDPNDPNIVAKLGPAMKRLKGAGQVQPPQPGDNPPQGQPIPAAQAPPAGVPSPQVAQAPPQGQSQVPPPQQAPQAQQSPFANAIATGLIPPGADPLRYVAGLKIRQAQSPDAGVRESATKALEAINKASELTAGQRDFNASSANPKMDEHAVAQKGAETSAVDDAKLYSTKYHTFVDSGTKAQQEIPQLEMLQEQMKDPNFFSGSGERYNLAFKRLKSAMGIDPDAAVPQEFMRKAVAASVLGSFGALKGLGPIRVAEMNLAKTAAAAPENSIPANKLLIEIQKRTYQRQADIAERAQEYKEANGALDPGFDKQVTAYFKSHPIFNDAEIKDFHKAIGEAPKGAAPAGAPTDFPNARKAPDGNWYVPDPSRGPNKYLRVAQ